MRALSATTFTSCPARFVTPVLSRSNHQSPEPRSDHQSRITRDQLFWASDSGNFHLSQIELRFGDGEADFFGNERDGSRCLDAGAGWLAGVAIEAAGSVDGEDGNAAAIDGGDDLVEGGTRRAGQAGAENRVENQGRLCALDQLGVGGGGGELHGLRDLPVHQGLVLVSGGVGGEDDVDIEAGVVEMTGGGEAVAAVVAAAAEDQDGFVF
jgi:hypothetical protein